jgi:hypothetical protein
MARACGDCHLPRLRASLFSCQLVDGLVGNCSGSENGDGNLKKGGKFDMNPCAVFAGMKSSVHSVASTRLLSEDVLTIRLILFPLCEKCHRAAITLGTNAIDTLSSASSLSPSSQPSSIGAPSSQSSAGPSLSGAPSSQPSSGPSVSSALSCLPSSGPSLSGAPSSQPSAVPSVSAAPSSQPTSSPSTGPSVSSAPSS